MAITPRTILSRPIHLLLFAFSILALGGLVGLLAGAADSGKRPCLSHAPPDSQADLDAGDVALGDGPTVGVDQAVAGDERDLLDYTCQLEEPTPSWSEGQWIRHLECMEARGEVASVLLAEATEAIDEVGLTPDLALMKADYIKASDSDDAHVDFLRGAVTRLGVADGQLVHELARALTWRGDEADLERIRHLQLLSRMLMPESCEVLQTDIWARYALADQLAQGASPAAWQGVTHAIDTYLRSDCHERLEQEEWDVFAEIAGVGIVAEATNGHSGHSTLIRNVVEASEIGHVESFCEEAVPAKLALRAQCEKRVGDEIFLAR